MIPNELKQIQTKKHYTGDDRFLYASHWIRFDGEKIKLSAGLKLYWQYRVKHYRAFTNKGLPYYETIQTVGDKLGITKDTIKGYHKTLVKMNLLQTEGNATSLHNRFRYHFLPLSSLEGWLVNYSLEGVKPVKSYKQEDNDTPITYKQIKNIEYNQQQYKRWVTYSEDKIKGLPFSEWIRLKEIERDFKQLQKDIGNDE